MSCGRASVSLMKSFAVLAVLLLGACMQSQTAVVNRGNTSDDKEVTARNLAQCKKLAEAAKLSVDSPSYSRTVEDCVRKQGVVRSEGASAAGSSTR